MSLSMFIDPWAVAAIVLIIAISRAFTRNRDPGVRREQFGDLTQSLSYTVSIVFLVIALSRLDDPAYLGPVIAFALMTALYGSAVKILVSLFPDTAARQKPSSSSGAVNLC